MKIFSQVDPAWKNIKLGSCKDTIGQSGCFLVSLSMIAGKTPPEVNELLKQKGGYSNGCMVNSEKATQILGLEYNGRITTPPDELCIAETDHYKSKGVPQHFFIWDNGLIIDPLDFPAHWKDNKYRIVSYRLISNNNQMENHIVENILSRAKKYLGIDAGTRINKAEDEKIGDAIKDLAVKKEEQDKTIKMFEDVLEETRDELIKSQNMMKTLEASFNVQFADKQTQINYQTDMLVKRAEEYEALLKDYAEVQDKLDRLEAVQGRDVENTKAMDALRFFIKTLFKKNE